jgi:hypothetical protein
MMVWTTWLPAFRRLVRDPAAIAASVATCRRHVDEAVGAPDRVAPRPARAVFARLAIQAAKRAESVVDRVPTGRSRPALPTEGLVR